MKHMFPFVIILTTTTLIGIALFCNSPDELSPLSTTSTSSISSSDSSTNYFNISSTTFFRPPIPSSVENLSITEGDQQLTLSWTIPQFSYSTFRYVLIYRKQGAAPTEGDLGTLVIQTTEESYIDYQVQNGVTYNYSMIIYDNYNQHSAPETISGTPTNNMVKASISSPATDETIIINQSLSFSATAIDGDPPYSYSWSFPSASGISSQYTQEPGSLTFTGLGTHFIFLFVSDADGDASMANRVITVRHPYSCMEIKTEGMDTGNGLYTIDPDGLEGDDPFDVYCDMTESGGGWTLVIAKEETDADKNTEVIPSTMLYNQTYTIEEFGGSFPPTGNHIYQGYEEVTATEIRITDRENGYDGTLSFATEAISLDAFYRQNCYMHPVEINQDMGGGNWMHLCTSWDEGVDGESIVMGWSSAENCTSGDYCSEGIVLSALETSATTAIVDSHHYSYGDVLIWVR